MRSRRRVEREGWNAGSCSWLTLPAEDGERRAQQKDQTATSHPQTAGKAPLQVLADTRCHQCSEYCATQSAATKSGAETTWSIRRDDKETQRDTGRVCSAVTGSQLVDSVCSKLVTSAVRVPTRNIAEKPVERGRARSNRMYYQSISVTQCEAISVNTHNGNNGSGTQHTSRLKQSQPVSLLRGLTCCDGCNTSISSFLSHRVIHSTSSSTVGSTLRIKSWPSPALSTSSLSSWPCSTCGASKSTSRPTSTRPSTTNSSPKTLLSRRPLLSRLCPSTRARISSTTYSGCWTGRCSCC